jgi:IPT/TIG domain
MRIILFFGIIIVTIVACKKKNFNETIINTGPAPVIQSIVPNKAQYDDTITVNGQNFGSSLTSTRVLINSQTIIPLSVTNTQVKFVLPKGAGSGTINIGNSGNIGVGPTYEYLYKGNVSLFAGNGNTTPLTGSATATGLDGSLGLTTDGNNNIYVGLLSDNRIRKIDPSGNVTLLPAIDNTSTTQINDVFYQVVSGVPSLWVTTSSHRVYLFNLNTQTYSIVAGQGQGYHIDGMLGATQSTYLNNPYGIASRADGSLMIAEIGNKSIRRLVYNSAISTPVGDPIVAGDINATGSMARFTKLYGICAIGNDEFLVCDLGVDKIKKISSNYSVTTFAGTTLGSEDGPVATAKFNGPIYPVKDNLNNVLITCLDGSIRCVSPSGYVYTVAGSPSSTAAAVMLDATAVNLPNYANGIGKVAKFKTPTKIIFIGNATFLIADYGNKRIRKMILE